MASHHRPQTPSIESPNPKNPIQNPEPQDPNNNNPGKKYSGLVRGTLSDKPTDFSVMDQNYFYTHSTV